MFSQERIYGNLVKSNDWNFEQLPVHKLLGNSSFSDFRIGELDCTSPSFFGLYDQQP